jgi:ankyrin repeat protein
MAAAACGRLEVVERLLEAGADPGHKNKWGLGAEDWSQWPNNAAEIGARLRSRDA